MTLVDTHVVIDLLQRQSAWHGFARTAVERAASQGLVVLNHIVLAEVMATPFPDRTAIGLAAWRFPVMPLGDEVSVRAGRAQRLYRSRGGERTAIIADFLIGAHAAVLGIPLITRDRQRFASYFPELTIIAPETHP